MTDSLTLYVDANYDSPWAMSAFVALEEKHLPYTLQTRVLSKKETFGADYKARTHRVPALQRGDFWLAESTAIQEYLAESFPFPKHPRLYPENLEQRATCREVQHWLRTDLLALRQERPTTTLWFARATTPLSAAGQEAAKRLVDVAMGLLSHGRTTLFESWCVADADLALMLQRLVLNGEPVPEVLSKYAKTNWERPSLAKWHALPRGATPV
jgi:glutathione S-transferase